MEPIRDYAIILKSVPFEDRHRIVTAITEHHGRLTALAKNSIQSRRFGGTLEPFVASQWTFTQKANSDLALLTEAQIKRDYHGISKDFDRLSLASALTEVMLRIAPEHEPCVGLFKLHANALAWVEEAQTEELKKLTLLFFNHFLIKTLQLGGSLPQLDCCLSCESALSDWVASHPPTELSATVSRAGWICPQCRAAGAKTKIDDGEGAIDGITLKIPASALRDVLVSLQSPIRSLQTTTQGLPVQPQGQEKILRWMESILLYHAPGMSQTPLKSFRFIHSQGGDLSAVL